MVAFDTAIDWLFGILYLRKEIFSLLAHTLCIIVEAKNEKNGFRIKCAKTGSRIKAEVNVKTKIIALLTTYKQKIGGHHNRSLCSAEGNILRH